jgi:hypothetical protein
MKKPWLKGPHEGLLFPLRDGFIVSGCFPFSGFRCTAPEPCRTLASTHWPLMTCYRLNGARSLGASRRSEVTDHYPDLHLAEPPTRFNRLLRKRSGRANKS